MQQVVGTDRRPTAERTYFYDVNRPLTSAGDTNQKAHKHSPAQAATGSLLPQQGSDTNTSMLCDSGLSVELQLLHKLAVTVCLRLASAHAAAARRLASHLFTQRHAGCQSAHTHLRSTR